MNKPVSTKPELPEFIRAAYDEGQSYCDDNSGFVFRVHLNNGHMVEYAPDDTADGCAARGYLSSPDGDYMPFSAVALIKVFDAHDDRLAKPQKTA